MPRGLACGPIRDPSFRPTTSGCCEWRPGERDHRSIRLAVFAGATRTHVRALRLQFLRWRLVRSRPRRHPLLPATASRRRLPASSMRSPPRRRSCPAVQRVHSSRNLRARKSLARGTWSTRAGMRRAPADRDATDRDQSARPWDCARPDRPITCLPASCLPSEYRPSVRPPRSLGSSARPTRTTPW